MGEVAGIEVMVNRTGYTGEKGVELMVMTEDAVALWDAVLDRGAAPCGLGARDTLRLEVCYPLHGNDIGPDTDAISAGLGWVCALDTEFSGVEELRRIKAEGPAQKLVAFVMQDAGIPRQGMAIAEGGEVTSGSHSPMLDRGIGMGYVPAEHAEPGTTLTIDVRGRPRRAEVVKKPIYKKEA
jgi:aminomethyltransferase